MEQNPFLKGNFTEEQTQMLEMWQDHFCQLTGVCVCAFDAAGNRLTRLSGEAEDRKRMEEVVSIDRMRMIHNRILQSPLEDQAVENTEAANVKLAVAAIRDAQRRVILDFVVIAVCSGAESVDLPVTRPMLEGVKNCLSQEKLIAALALIRSTMSAVLELFFDKAEVLQQNENYRKNQEEMNLQKRQAEAMTKIVSFLDSDEPIDKIMEQEIAHIGSFLGLSHAFVMHLHRSDPLIDVSLQWCAEGESDIFSRTRDLEHYWFLKEPSIQVISGEAQITAAEKETLEKLGIRALAVCPVQVNEQPAFYACFAECRKEHVFRTVEIKFLTDAIRILQNIITKRNQRNSLAGSYAALESMLDNIGSSIYVRDIETNRLLFANRSLRSRFSKELKEGTLQQLFEGGIPSQSHSGNCEIYHEDRNHWYDLYYTRIKWVDYRPVFLCAIYDVTEKKVYQRRIEQQAYTDFLTGLYNRMCCERDLVKYIEEAKRTGSKGAVLYMDLDDFKHINDGLGHQYGDLLLKSISKALSETVGIHNSCYRMGGDEFVIIVPARSYHLFEEIIAHLQDIFSRPWLLKDTDYYCTMSMGTVDFPEEGTTVTELIQKADIAMYEAKKSGKNRIAKYSDNIQTHSSKRLDMEKKMRDASLRDYDEFEVYFQPIVNAQEEGTPCVGAEALARWNSKDGFVPPSDFIPLAEYLGLINPIGNHVLEVACLQCKEWNDRGYPDFTINVNLSVVQLLQPDIIDVIKNAIEKSGIRPSNLTLEVTESLAINDLDRTKSILKSIKNLGVKLALDDFGTGYSSLNNIRVLPFDIIKVDQNFVKDLTEDSYSQAFIRMIAELADAISADICVEGIETGQQLKVLEDMKVKFIQGYYFSKPITREAFEKKYIRPVSGEAKENRKKSEEQ